MNNLKDLYLLLEEENLTSPAHQSDKRAASDEQPLSPTIKVGDNQAVRPHNPPSYRDFSSILLFYFSSAYSGRNNYKCKVIKLNVTFFLKQ